MQRPFFQIRYHSWVLGIRTWICLWELWSAYLLVLDFLSTVNVESIAWLLFFLSLPILPQFLIFCYLLGCFFLNCFQFHNVLLLPLNVWLSYLTFGVRSFPSDVPFHSVPVYLCSLSRVRLCDPVDYSPPGSSVHGILPAGIWSGLPLLLQFIYMDAHLWLPLSVVSTLLNVPCFRWVLFFRCFSFSVTWELSSVSALVTCLYFKMSKKKTIPAEALCQCVYRMGEGQLVNPWPSVFHDHVGSRISYRDQTTSTPFPPCSLSFRDKPSNLSLGSLNFTVYVFFL